jgi:hypothetical protein
MKPNFTQNIVITLHDLPDNMQEHFLKRRKRNTMNDDIPNVWVNVHHLRTSVTKELKRLKKELPTDDPRVATFLAALQATEHQLKSIRNYWVDVCLKAYKKSGATSHLFQENRKTLTVTLRDSNEEVKGKNQNEVFVNAMKSLGLKACYDACLKAGIYAVTSRKEFLVDTKAQSGAHVEVLEKGITYYVFTNFSAKAKVKQLKRFEKPLNCAIHASCE